MTNGCVASSIHKIRIVTEHSGEMDPSSLEQYRARDGYCPHSSDVCVSNNPRRSSKRSSKADSADVAVGGYPTGAKWRKVERGSW